MNRLRTNQEETHVHALRRLLQQGCTLAQIGKHFVHGPSWCSRLAKAAAFYNVCTVDTLAWPKRFTLSPEAKEMPAEKLLALIAKAFDDTAAGRKPWAR